MNSKNIAAAQKALKILHIAEACTKYVSNILTFSKINQECHNLSKQFKKQDHVSIKLFSKFDFYLENSNNCFFSDGHSDRTETFEDQSSFIIIINKLPPSYWVFVNEMKFSICVKNSTNYLKDIEFTTSILQIFIQKAKYIRHIRINDIKIENKIIKGQTILCKILSCLKSDLVNTISIPCNFKGYLTETPMLNIIMKQNFMNVSVLSINEIVKPCDYYSDKTNDALADLVELTDYLSKSYLRKQSKIYNVFVGINSVKEIKKYFDYLNESHIKYQIDEITWDEKSLDSLIHSQSTQYLTKLRFMDFIAFNDFMNITNSRIPNGISLLHIYQNIKKLVLIFDSIQEFDLTSGMDSFQHLLNLKEVWLEGSLYGDREINGLREDTFLRLLPKTIESLTILNFSTDIQKMENKLGSLFPDLKSISFGDRHYQWLSFNENYLLEFKDLQMVTFQCPLEHDYIIPSTLRVFVITECERFTVNLKSLNKNEFAENVKIEKACDCCYHRRPFKNSVKYTSTDDTNGTIYYKSYNDLNLFLRNNPTVAF